MIVEHLGGNVQKSVGNLQLGFSSKIKAQKCQCQDHYTDKILDIIRVNDNTDDKYADMKRTRWLMNYIWQEGWELEKERSVGNYDSAVPQLQTCMSLWSGSDV